MHLGKGTPFCPYKDLFKGSVRKMLRNGFTINRKIFFGSSVSPAGFIFSPPPYPRPNFLKEETEAWEVSKLPKVSELVNAFNLKSVAKTLEGVGWIGGEGRLSPCIVQMPKTPQVTQIKFKQFTFYMQKDKTS